MLKVDCPVCKYLIKVPIAWAIKNERIFCENCCKSFEIHVGEEENEPPVKQDEKVEAALEELEKEIDKVIDEYSWF